jgi:hypothetical protein
MLLREGFRFHKLCIMFREGDTLPTSWFPRMDGELLIGGDKEGDFVVAVQNSFGQSAAATEL